LIYRVFQIGKVVKLNCSN